MKKITLTLTILFTLFSYGCGNPANGFGVCGDVENFEAEKWFEDFLNKIQNENNLDTEDANFMYESNKLSLEKEKNRIEEIQELQRNKDLLTMTPDTSEEEIEEIESELGQLFPEEFIQRFGKIKKGNIKELCLSKKKDIAVVIVDGDYCTHIGSVFRYDIPKSKLERAKFEDNRKHCDVTFSSFEKSADEADIIRLIGEFGDAGFKRTDYFDYNFVDNTIHRKKTCSKTCVSY
jgi:hypothetical protein